MAQRQKSTTRLPKSLLDEINGQSESSHPSRGKARHNPSRKETRKLHRQEVKSRRTDFFARSALGIEGDPNHNPRKRLAPPPQAENSSTKRPRLGSIKAPLTLDKTKTSRKVTFDEGVNDGSRKAVATESIKAPNTKTKAPKLGSTTIKRPIKQRSQVEEDEEAEIAWLEAKLGVRRPGKRNALAQDVFAEDGLGELWQDLDRIVSTRPPLPQNETETESEDSDSEDDSQSELSSSEDGDAGSETVFTGIVPERDSEAMAPSDVSIRDPINPVETLPVSGRYIPPHLRHRDPSGPTIEQTDEQKQLARQVQGLLNKLSEQNIGTILQEFEMLYRNHGRNYVTTTVTKLIIDSIASHSSLLDSFVILHAALVSSFHKVIGIEFAAHFIQTLVSTYEDYYKLTVTESLGNSIVDPAGTSTKGKETSNLLILVSELYRFQVISCLLVYDIIRTLLDSTLSELDVELLLKLLQNCGPQLRHDDPSALKDIVGIVEAKVASDAKSQSSRTRFMLETLSNLKANKATQKRAQGSQNQDLTMASADRMKKFLSGLGKKQTSRSQEPLNVSLADLQSADKRGKWWLVGAAWAGDPLSEHNTVREEKAQAHAVEESQEQSVSASLEKLAKQQGMNSDIRRSIFVALMTSDDYVDACQNLGQLSLSEIQQRDIIRVILHCCGNEKTYNPYYTLIVQRLCELSHSHKITLQYCLWDFLRELGETAVGGEELVKGLNGRSFGTAVDVSKTKAKNLARAYAWWIAKGAVTLSVLKPIDFISIQPQTVAFLSILISQLLVSSQTASPILDASTASASDAKTLSRDREVLEIIVMKMSRHASLAQGVVHFLNNSHLERMAKSDNVARFIEWGVGIMVDTLRMGTDVALTLD